MNLLDLAERRWLPDFLIRLGIRRLLRERLARAGAGNPEAQRDRVAELAAELRESPIVLEAAAANQQHYEVPVAFFQKVLGRRLKYSCGHWPLPTMSLEESEEAMLQLTCRRAEIADRMEVLDLGCGWGSLSIWIAERYPATRVLAVSNSHTQRNHIERVAAERGLTNLEVRTANVADFDTERRFDRVVSVEMFEHVRNYERLLERIAGWLEPEGKLFVHIFCHRELAYPFEDEGDSDWMARHFFSGGLMPSASLLHEFDRHLRVDQQWHVAGTHYGQTCEAWLIECDRHKDELLSVFAAALSPAEARIQLQRWRMFFMACAELFNFRGGREWGVDHYLFVRQPQEDAAPRVDEGEPALAR